MRIWTLISLPVIATAWGNFSIAMAQVYPVRPVKVILTSGPGSAPDIAARSLAGKLVETWGQQVLIENVPGAAGNIGAERAAKSAPDGYTFLYATAGPLQFNRSLYPKLGYDIVGDFEPITQIGRSPNILAVHPSVPVKTVQELILFARANPGKLRFGSSGNGTSLHLSGELFKKMAGVDIVHVPYKESGQMTMDLVSGQFELTFQNAAAIIPYIKRGQVKALAVTTTERIPLLPELPTVSESGVTGFEMTARSGLLAPKGTPAVIINKVRTDLSRAMVTPAVRDLLAANGIDVAATTSEQFATWIKDENTRWAPIVKASGAKVD